MAGVLRFGNNIQIPQQVDEMKGVDELTDEQAPKVGDSVEIQQVPCFLAKIVQLDGESRCFVMLEWMQKKLKPTCYKELQFK